MAPKGDDKLRTKHLFMVTPYSLCHTLDHFTLDGEIVMNHRDLGRMRECWAMKLLDKRKNSSNRDKCQ